MTTNICDIKARQIFDSRGNPTVEVDVILENGTLGRASIPSGASTGRHEAVELRDGEMAFQGKGVLKAIENVNGEILATVQGMDASEIEVLDQTLIDLDGTPNKSRLGANAILGVSLASAKAAAISYNMPLYRFIGGVYAKRMPIPLMNVLNGGCHADNPLDIQEFMLVPLQEGSFEEGLHLGVHIFHHLKSILKSKGYATNVGDEGGFAPALTSAYEAMDLLLEACMKAGFKPMEDVGFALDVAASELYKNGSYTMEGKLLSSEELIAYYASFIERGYPLVSIEDGMAEDDWQGWQLLTQSLGADLQLVGDDIFVTNLARLEEGFEKGVANAILIKPNQIGTLSETAYVIKEAQREGYQTIMSHRSGETEDTSIADLSVAFGCDQIKTGSLCRTDRIAKYNQLLRIEESL